MMETMIVHLSSPRESCFTSLRGRKLISRSEVNVRSVIMETTKMIVTGRLRVDIVVTKVKKITNVSERDDIAIVTASAKRRRKKSAESGRGGIIMRMRQRRNGRSVEGGGGNARRKESASTRSEIGHPVIAPSENHPLVSHIVIDLGRVIGHIDHAIPKWPV